MVVSGDPARLWWCLVQPSPSLRPASLAAVSCYTQRVSPINKHSSTHSSSGAIVSDSDTQTHNRATSPPRPVSAEQPPPAPAMDTQKSFKERRSYGEFLLELEMNLCAV